VATIEAYCVKCKEKRTVEEQGRAEMKNGALRAYGQCPTCGTNVSRMMSKKQAEG
jgi:hypothetical protein